MVNCCLIADYLSLYRNRDIKMLIQKSLRSWMTQSIHVWGSKRKGKIKRKEGRNRKGKKGGIEKRRGEMKKEEKEKSTLHR